MRRVVVTGMGKSGHICNKIVATLSSTGTPSLFVHPAEASHGDLGMIEEGDAVLAYSNSGETPELSDIIAYTRRFKLPLVAVTNLSRTLKQLKQRGLWVVGTAGEAEQLIYDVDFTVPSIIIMGAEGAGMRRLTREHCDYLAKLPMAGSVSSLNVSVAAGICLFEAVRQRGAAS